MPRSKPPAPKAWAGRMSEPTHPLVESFSTSFPFDRRLWSQDIRGSLVHCQMLARQGIIPKADGKTIAAGLRRVLAEFEEGTFAPQAGDEDIHMAVERRLIEIVGPVGGKLHTARSRNDQVALDLRLYVREAAESVRELLRELQEALAGLARRHRNVVMPGYTHLQPAQPVLLAHHLLAYAQMLERDRDRIGDQHRRINVLPLGSGALAGTTFPIDRDWVAKRLGFDSVAENSMDAVSDRDFVVEFLAALALVGVHLSRFSEDLILWCSQEFGFVTLPDAFATGSSIMPQKKNPDVAELVRGKSGRLFGNLMALLTTLKGLPMTYNRDLQEDKEPLFDSVDTVSQALEVLAAMVPRLQVREDRLTKAAPAGYTLATELADYLSRQGVPFREAHGIVGAIVQDCLGRGIGLEELTLAELQGFAPQFGPDVLEWLSPLAAVKRRTSQGGTSPESITRQLRLLRL